jgi:hypothetical protein
LNIRPAKNVLIYRKSQKLNTAKSELYGRWGTVTENLQQSGFGAFKEWIRALSRRTFRRRLWFCLPFGKTFVGKVSTEWVRKYLIVTGPPGGIISMPWHPSIS